jgi:hypothetical protein
VLDKISRALRASLFEAEAGAISQVLQLCLSERELGGLNLSRDSVPDGDQLKEIKFLVEAWLETLNSEENSKGLRTPISGTVKNRKPMNLTEKILSHHATSAPSPGGVTTGDLITVTVDWIIASELSWTVSCLFSILS